MANAAKTTTPTAPAIAAMIGHQRKALAALLPLAAAAVAAGGGEAAADCVDGYPRMAFASIKSTSEHSPAGTPAACI